MAYLPDDDGICIIRSIVLSKYNVKFTGGIIYLPLYMAAMIAQVRQEIAIPVS